MAKFTTVDEYLATLGEPLRQVGETIRPLIDAVLPRAGAIWHGCPVWSLGSAPGRRPICLLKASPSYLTLGLWRGREISDRSGRMEVARGMAHTKLRTTADIDAALFTDWLRQARDLEAAPASSGGER